MTRTWPRAAGLLLIAMLPGAAAHAIASASGSPSTGKGCAPAAPTTLRSSRSGAAASLVPPGATTLRLCRYDGPLGSPSRRVRNRFPLVAGRWLSDRQRVAALAAAFNRLATAKGSYACPADTGTAIVGYFGYPSGPVSPVRVELTGCMIATNGHLFRLAGLDQATLLDELEALVHAGASPTAPAGGGALITGEIRLCGGPAPGRCFVSTVTGCAPRAGCAESDRVIALDGSGKVAGEQALSARHARFRLRVRAGNYVVELLADGRHVRDRLLQAAGATARRQHPASVVFRFDVP